MQTLLEIVLFLIGFIIIVLVHESGHFFVSKLMKFTCEEFSVGIGPKIFEKEYKGTRFQLRAIPFGGFCMFKEFEAYYNPGEKVRSFYLKKILVLLAGPFANVILAFIIMIAAPGNLEGLKVDEVKEEQLISAGIERGDIIRKINEERVYCMEDIKELLIVGADNTINFYNERYEKENVSFFCEGVELDVVFDDGFKNKLNGAGRIFKEMFAMIFEAVGELFTDEDNMVGQVVYNPYSEMDSELDTLRSLSRDVHRCLLITVVFAFGVGMTNLLPIVCFDGFKVLIALPVLVLNRKLSENAYIAIGVAGVIFSLILIF